MVTYGLADQLRKVLGYRPSEKKDTDFILPRLAEMYKHDGAGVSNRLNKVFSIAGIERLEDRSPKARGRKRISRFGCHAFRVFGVSVSAREGVPLEELRAWLGHHSQEITRIYLRFSASQKRSPINAVAKALSR